MIKEQKSNYDKVISAIELFETEFRSSDEKINFVQIQQIFKEWANLSSASFFHGISKQQLKCLITKRCADLFDAVIETEVFTHHAAVDMERFSEEITGKTELNINYQFVSSIFGEILIASTNKGICHLTFYEDKSAAFSLLKSSFPTANLREASDDFQENGLQFFNKEVAIVNPVKLHLKATDFQFQVWNALLKIPAGALTTYGEIATSIGKPKASRAVGTAIGSNSVAFIIPCHRVIQASGMLGGYRWGISRKKAIIGWETATL